MTTGTFISGSSFCVLALNALQNSMMLTPCWPSAGPIGGAGFALPAGICSLIYPSIFFAMFDLRSRGDARECPHLFFFRKGHLFDLEEVKFVRGRAPKDGDRHL